MEHIKTCNRCGIATSLFHKGQGRCISCCKEIKAIRHKENPKEKPERDRLYREKMGEALRAKKRAYQQANKAKENTRCREWYAANGDFAKESASKWHKLNPELQQAYIAQWKQDNKGRVRAISMARKKRVKQATPIWADKFFLEEAHDLAVRRTLATGFSWQVDHIEPIKGKDVCGLHVIENIRVIPQRINSIKKNNRVLNAHWLGFESFRIQTDESSAKGTHGRNYGQATNFYCGTK